MMIGGGNGGSGAEGVAVDETGDGDCDSGHVTAVTGGVTLTVMAGRTARR